MAIVSNGSTSACRDGGKVRVKLPRCVSGGMGEKINCPAGLATTVIALMQRTVHVSKRGN